MKGILETISQMFSFKSAQMGSKLVAAVENKTEGESRAAITKVPPGWRYMKATDSKGNVIEEKWEFVPPGIRYETGGLSYLPEFVTRLLQTNSWSASILASTLHDDKCFQLHKLEGIVTLCEIFPGRKQSDVEYRARQICSERGFSIEHDYLTKQSDRVITWIMPHNVVEIMETIRLFATEIHKIPLESGLEIEYNESPDEREQYVGVGSIQFTFTYPEVDPMASAPV